MTPGGRTEIAPSAVTILDNVIQCGVHYQGIYAENVPNISVRGNQIFGAGAVTRGAWDSGNAGSGIIIDGQHTLVSTNRIRGFRYGMSGPSNTRVTLGDPGMVSGNVISDCYVGILGASPGAVTISGNAISNCVRPLVVGEAGAAAKPCKVAGNSATGCVYGMEVGGKLILLKADSTTQAVGTGRSLYVSDHLLKLPLGSVISFMGGGVFTVTTAVPTSRSDGPDPYEIVGDVTVAAIGPGEVGIATELPHSTVPANNHVAVINNVDIAVGS